MYVIYNGVCRFFKWFTNSDSFRTQRIRYLTYQVCHDSKKDTAVVEGIPGTSNTIRVRAFHNVMLLLILVNTTPTIKIPVRNSASCCGGEY